MNNLNHKEIFFNRAEVEQAERITCEHCFEPVVFLLSDKEHKFSIGLSTILQCLNFAIKNGDLPKLPSSWCSDVNNAFDFYLDEEVSYYDQESFKKRNPLK